MNAFVSICCTRFYPYRSVVYVAEQTTVVLVSIRTEELFTRQNRQRSSDAEILLPWQLNGALTGGLSELKLAYSCGCQYWRGCEGRGVVVLVGLGGSEGAR